jgi:hypothetical protein
VDSRLAASEFHIVSGEYLQGQAEKCRRLARGIDDPATRESLYRLAAEYDRQAAGEIGAVPNAMGPSTEENS